MHALAVVVFLVLAGCGSSTGVRTSPDFTAANLVPLPPELAPATIEPPKPTKMRGVNAIARAQAGVLVQAEDRDIEGNTWIIRDVDPRKVYVIPVAPLSPTTILLPVGESLTQSVSGSTKDFTIAPAVTGDRAAVTIMPNCASPNTERWGEEAEVPMVKCLTGRARATFLTSAMPYTVEFQVYDYTAAQIVEINHADPPPTNLGRSRVPVPRGPAQALTITPVGDWAPAWQPLSAYADQTKMVIQFGAPLPALPALWAGGLGDTTPAVINYSVVETTSSVYFVTDRRVTEAELRIGDQRVRISAGPSAKSLTAGSKTRGKTT